MVKVALPGHRRTRKRALLMRRFFVVAIGVIGASAATDGVAQPKMGRTHAPKPLTGESIVRQSDALALNKTFSDPYLSSYHGIKTADFAPIQRRPPVEPQGGFSIRAGRDNPGDPMTGGLKFRF